MRSDGVEAEAEGSTSMLFREDSLSPTAWFPSSMTGGIMIWSDILARMGWRRTNECDASGEWSICLDLAVVVVGIPRHVRVETTWTILVPAMSVDVVVFGEFALVRPLISRGRGRGGSSFIYSSSSSAVIARLYYYIMIDVDMVDGDGWMITERDEATSVSVSHPRRRLEDGR